MGNLRITVSNSTPLVNFAAIDRLDILEKLFFKICVPKAVERELLTKGATYSSKPVLEAHWPRLIDTMEVENTALCNVLRLNLDDGEAEAVALAIEHGAKMLLLDETAGRAVAESRGIPIVGSIGCLVRAKRIGLIAEIKSLMDCMMNEARFWINPRLYNAILKDNGEM